MAEKTKAELEHLHATARGMYEAERRRSDQKDRGLKAAQKALVEEQKAHAETVAQMTATVQVLQSGYDRAVAELRTERLIGRTVLSMVETINAKLADVRDALGPVAAVPTREQQGPFGATSKPRP